MAYTGLSGIEIVTSISPIGSKPISGLAGLAITLEGNLPIKVVDKRGFPLQGVKVTITNPTGTPSIGFTDVQGNCVVTKNAANPNPVKVEKDKAFYTINYTTGATFTIFFEPPVLN
jgi:hypothetical protein